MRAFSTGLFGTRTRKGSPFHPAPDRPPLIVHCCHHKVGTLWLTRVLRAVAAEYGLRFFAGEQHQLTADVDVFLQDHSRVDASALRPHRGSHMIRDPRDVVVSAYFYHLRTDEAWCHRPRAEYDGRSYQAWLRALDREAGIMAEIERSAGTVIRDMLAWRESVEGFHEMRYEDLLRDEATGFLRLFDHYGFSADAARRGTEIARRFSIARSSGATAHIRSGRPGEWREHFSEAHKRAFKRLTDDAALALGYAASSEW